MSDGIAYDDRYESKKAIREKPIMEIHSNRLPKRRMMSDYKYTEIVYDGRGNFINGREWRNKNMGDSHKLAESIHSDNKE